MISKFSALAPTSERLEFARFTDGDVVAFADVLSDPEVTRSIMAKATTPQQCLECARQRIDWHNSSRDTLGYGVWALREKPQSGARSGRLIGWCGLVATSHGPTPEILYGLSRNHWGNGLATEAASATIDWAFRENICDGIDAAIFGPLNPGSSTVALKLGMTFCGQMRFDKFLPDLKLGRDVLNYEIWRLGAGACLNFEALLFQAPFKSGLLVSAGVADQAEIIEALLSAAKQHPCRDGTSDSEIDRHVRDAFDRGLRECNLDLYRISRENWAADRSHAKV